MSILIISCLGRRGPTTINGTIIDAKTKKTIDNIQIVAGGSLTGIYSSRSSGSDTTYSNEDGIYSMKIGSKERSTVYSVVFTKTGYCVLGISHIAGGEDYSFYIELHKEKRAIVKREYQINNKADSLIERLEITSHYTYYNYERSYYNNPSCGYLLTYLDEKFC